MEGGAEIHSSVPPITAIVFRGTSKKPCQALQHQSMAGIEELWGGRLALCGTRPQAASDDGITAWATLAFIVLSAPKPRLP